MTLTQAQYESAYVRAILYFSCAVAIATTVQAALTIAVGVQGTSTSVWLPIVGGILIGVIAAFFAAFGSGLVAIVIGLILTVGVARLIKDVSHWKAHFIAYFAIGAVAALVPVGLFVWAVLGSESMRQFAGDWLTILDLVVILILAGLSTSLAWHHVWRRGSVADSSQTLKVSTTTLS